MKLWKAFYSLFFTLSFYNCSHPVQSKLLWPKFGKITSPYGHRARGFHHGIDIKGRIGDRVRASGPGRVVYSGWMRGYGKTVMISHVNGYLTVYGHLSRINVRKNHYVSARDLLGSVGTTGRVTGPHLHFEIRSKGKGSLNPMNYLSSPRSYLYTTAN